MAFHEQKFTNLSMKETHTGKLQNVAVRHSLHSDTHYTNNKKTQSFHNYSTLSENPNWKFSRAVNTSGQAEKSASVSSAVTPSVKPKSKSALDMPEWRELTEQTD